MVISILGIVYYQAYIIIMGNTVVVIVCEIIKHGIR